MIKTGSGSMKYEILPVIFKKYSLVIHVHF